MGARHQAEPAGYLGDARCWAESAANFHIYRSITLAATFLIIKDFVAVMHAYRILSFSVFNRAGFYFNNVINTGN